MMTTVMATECIEHGTQNIFRGAAIALLLSLPFWLGVLGAYWWS